MQNTNRLLIKEIYNFLNCEIKSPQKNLKVFYTNSDCKLRQFTVYVGMIKVHIFRNG